MTDILKEKLRKIFELDNYEFDTINRAELINLRSKYPISQIRNAISELNIDCDKRLNLSEKSKLQINKLIKEGYLLDFNSISKKAVSETVDFLQEFNFENKEKNNKVSGKNLIESKSEFTGTYWLTHCLKLLECNAIHNLVFNKDLMNIVSAYLCAPAKLMSVSSWISFPDKNKNLDLNAQLYHSDCEFLSFIKVFVYLNDVGSLNGPHNAIKKSHDQNALVFKGVPISGRLSNSVVNLVYPKEDILSIEGEAGRVIIGDTFCAHKGTNVEQGKRLMLQFQYASTSWGMPNQNYFCL